MEDVLSNQPRVATLTDHVSVDLVMNIRSARNLSPFMRGEQRLGDAAKVLSVAPSSLAYWVNRFLAAGLIEIVRHERRPGKPIPIYRAIADEFVVPFSAMPPGALSEFVHSGRRRVMDEFLKSVDRTIALDTGSGLKISAHPTRGVEITLVDAPGPDKPGLGKAAVTEFWGIIEMTAEQATEFGRSLEALVTTYTRAVAADGAPRKNYVVGVGLAPSATVR